MFFGFQVIESNSDCFSKLLWKIDGILYLSESKEEVYLVLRKQCCSRSYCRSCGPFSFVVPFSSFMLLRVSRFWIQKVQIIGREKCD